MGFSQIAGHARLVKILRRALNSGHVAHAYLFAGPEGVGKATVAWNFVKALQCRDQRDEACERCEACMKVSHGNHPDVVAVEPEGSQIRIDQIRDLQRQMIHRPLEGRWRAIVVDRAHDLTPQAANALLRILEEPPPGNVMILVARSTHSLLPTVVSRCQILRFSPIPPSEIALFLHEREGWPETDALRAAVQSRGSIRQALMLRETDSQEEGRLIKFLEDLPSLGSAEVLQTAQTWAGSRERARAGLELIRGLFRDLVLLHVGGTSLDNRDLEGELSRLKSCWRLHELLLGWEWITEALQGIERNWNPLMQMEQLFLRLNRIKRGASSVGVWRDAAAGA